MGRVIDVNFPQQGRPSKQAARKKRPAKSPAAYLRKLRLQSAQFGGQHFSQEQAPELFELARMADATPVGRASFLLNGIRFPLRFGFRRYVADPETGAFLVGGSMFAPIVRGRGRHG